MMIFCCAPHQENHHVPIMFGHVNIFFRYQLENLFVFAFPSVLTASCFFLFVEPTVGPFLPSTGGQDRVLCRAAQGAADFGAG